MRTGRGLISRLIKPRRFKRFQARDGAFVILGSSPARGPKLKILDIGQGGLSFLYQGNPAEQEYHGQLSLMAGRGLYLDYVPFEAVSDVGLSELTGQESPWRRRSIRFKQLGYLDVRQLREFIRRHCRF
ncbi:MAG: hypothetical protein AB1641_22820 [Thermodesulfobacteriota bacterium]